MLSYSIRVSESDDSSLNSEELEGSAASSRHHPFHRKNLCTKSFKNTNEDSDTGLESMSSAGTPNKRSCPICMDDDTNSRAKDNLKDEINKLKQDKLDLLRQNVVSIVVTLAYCDSMCLNLILSKPLVRNTIRNVRKF